MTRIVILDRDGVINQDSPHYIKNPNEWQAIPGSLEAIATLNQAGFKVIVATNQSGIARGLYTLTTLSNIHQKMCLALASYGGQISKIYICPHHDRDHCHCRKPNIGLFQQVKQDFNLDLSQTYAIGDSWRDIEAAKRAGCQPILVKTGNGAMTLSQHQSFLKQHRIPIYANLLQATHYILQR